jgi:hypothetical protein
MNAEKLKKLSIQIMIAGLIGAAVIAIVAVLAGSFNDTFKRALFTLLLVMFHALVSLAFLERTTQAPERSFKFFENAFFFIVVLSFFTSIFGVWEVLPGSLVGKLYLTYGVLLFACLHGQLLSQTRGKQSSIDTITDVNYVVMSLVILLILPLIWAADSTLGSFYYRILAACGIVDATLTILAVIFHRMYLQKHPQAPSVIFTATPQFDANGHPVPVRAEVQKRHVHPLVWILGIFLIGQLVLSLIVAVIGGLSNN